MLKNYLKIALRSLWKNKGVSFINIFGLAVGFTCCMLIAAFLYDELSYDKSPARAEDIYRVELNVSDKDFYSSVDEGVGPGMLATYPEVESFTKLIRWGNVFVAYENNKIKEKELALVDSNFLSFFSLPLIEGNINTALAEPNSVVLSREAAIKYFGNQEAMGKMLVINGRTEKPFKVTGIVGEPNGKLHFKFDIYIKRETRQINTWSNIGTYTYLRLLPNVDVKRLESKFPKLVAEHVVPEVQRDMGVSLAEAQKSVGSFKFFLKPLSAIHLYSNNQDEVGINGNIKYIYIFGALAVFILLLACVNFTNLSTAASIKRSKEVGVRKVMGSAKNLLVGQFLSESILLAFFAFVVALGVVYLLLPAYNNLSGKLIDFKFFVSAKALLIELAAVVLAGALAGIYPAFFISSFKTIKVLKGASFNTPGKGKTLRSGLVVFQFAVSTALIIATIIVYNQLHFMQNASLGFNKEQVLVINDTHLLDSNQRAFKQQLLGDTRVTQATISRDIPVSRYGDGTQAYAKQSQDNEAHAEIHLNKFHVDYEYVPTLGMQVINGRNFSKDFPSDSGSVILNETAVKEFGLGAGDAIGKTIVCSGRQEYKVIGIIKDFHYTSLRDKIAPLALMLGQNDGSMMVKVKTADIAGLLADMKSQWVTYQAKGPFSYSFLDDRFASVYEAEQKTAQIFILFASISIFIAAMGLFGLSAFTAQQRTKEIGVRKVLGATITQVAIMVSKEFVVMVLIAFCIAVPITWYAMHNWVNGFAYRAAISWWIFALAGVLALFIAIVTVSFQAIKAAVANPTKSLRSE